MDIFVPMLYCVQVSRDHHNIELCGGNVLGLCLYNPGIKDEISRIYLVHYQFLECGAMIRQNPATRPSTRDPEWLGWWCWLRCYKLQAWVVPWCHTASTMRAFNNSFEAFFWDHSPPAFISPRCRDQSPQPGEAPALCSRLRCRILRGKFSRRS